ncbi:MAG: hypothetical protein LH624_16145 [Cryobacterium sp.]|nr:hypothetical protein [Cryobacterium sp.]
MARGARQYRPALGWFLETDPIEGGATPSDYGYVSDPVNQQDLDGRHWEPAGQAKQRGAPKVVRRTRWRTHSTYFMPWGNLATGQFGLAALRVRQRTETLRVKMTRKYKWVGPRPNCGASACMNERFRVARWTETRRAVRWQTQVNGATQATSSYSGWTTLGTITSSERVTSSSFKWPK